MREHADNASPPDASAGHERTDAPIGPLLAAAGVLVAIAVAVHLILWGVMVVFEKSSERTDPAISPVASAQVPPAPMLQPTMKYHPTSSSQDMRTLREQNEKVLGSYGWVDREKGIVRIPIEVAMEKLLAQPQAATTQEAHR